MLFWRISSLFLVALLCAPSVALATSTSIPFSELGFGSDESILGPNPKFSLFVPVYPQLRSVHVRIPVTISPLVDRRSTVTLAVNEQPVYTATVASLGKRSIIDRVIPVPAGTRGDMNISLTGRFFRPGDVCYDLESGDFWMRVAHSGAINVQTAPLGRKPFVRDFLRDYGGRIAIVMPAQMDTTQKYSVLRLAYALHQVNRWRHTAVVLSSGYDRSARNIVVGNFSKALEVRGNDLYVNQDGISALGHQLDDLFITNSVSASSYNAAAAAPFRTRTFDDLGLGSQSQTGIGEMPFMIPLAVSQIGGLPSNLRLHIALTHTPLVPEDRAYLKVMMNSTLVRSFEFRQEGGEEDFDVPLDDDVLRSTNDLRIIPTYFNKRGACKGAYPKMTVSLLPSSNFSWDSVRQATPTVGDFYASASGRVVALVSDPSLAPYAFSVLSSLGTVNSAIKQLDVAPFKGSIPAGYDYAIVIAAPDKLAGVGVPLNSDGKAFTIDAQGGDGNPKALYRAQYSQAFGVLEVAKTMPVLVATYWKDAAATRGLDQIAPAELAAQTDDIFLFDQEMATYSSTTPHPHAIAKLDPIRQAMVPIIGLFLIALLALIAFAARRARSAS